MGERGLDENGGGDGLVVEEIFQCAEALEQGIGRRGHMSGIARACAADPILAAPELAGFLVRATAVAKKHSVDFADEPKGNRQTLFEKSHAAFQGGDIVRDLADIIERRAGDAIDLEKKQVGE
jgi:hypothetical protein